ncbi:hypothetical protein ACIBBB_07180 [Streptomyces sp. NPDC051217]|uniref:hypothetical protein n=1 Tax=Streptomyces sp. NPDC051217 TaxID=3365644 RepID=UPI0037ACFDFD
MRRKTEEIGPVPGSADPRQRGEAPCRASRAGRDFADTPRPNRRTYRPVPPDTAAPQAVVDTYEDRDHGPVRVTGTSDARWWAKTDDDSGDTNVFVSDVYISGGDNVQPLPGLPVC